MEEFRAVKGYEGFYEVSNLGRVKSLDRVVNKSSGNCRIKERILKQALDSCKYPVVGLSKNGGLKTKKVHKLVAIAFLNHIPCGHSVVVDHINHNKLDNNLSNLQLITNRENLSKDKVGSSKFTGVSWFSHTNKWRTQIVINSIMVYIGTFYCETKAGLMYQKALTNIDKYNGVPKDFRNLLNNL